MSELLNKMIEGISTVQMNLFCIVIISILIIIYANNIKRIKKLEKKYNSLMFKLGNGNNLENMLNKYIDKVEDVNRENEEIKEYCNTLNNNISKCVQKVGIVRYNAFHDTGSDLSFALALLNRDNDGVVLNGIYSREASNIYSKPIINGKSEYTLSKEEEEAIEQAIRKAIKQ